MEQENWSSSETFTQTCSCNNYESDRLVQGEEYGRETPHWLTIEQIINIMLFPVNYGLGTNMLPP